MDDVKKKNLICNWFKHVSFSYKVWITHAQIVHHKKVENMKSYGRMKIKQKTHKLHTPLEN